MKKMLKNLHYLTVDNKVDWEEVRFDTIILIVVGVIAYTML